jgi:hypothetical protein
MIDSFKMKDSFMVIRADLLRKTRQYDRLLREYTDIHFEDGFLNEIIAFELKLARNEDNSTYTVADIE